ncbi:hypothetical protein LV716_10240 [Flagellimonas sp. HMM57]|uniref:hypothetical protein n=1 Tax=unclassified Flagellimonas TaxID=2644544 RepID=UPI0013D04E57|nr:MULTISPECIES: hypothetical protein [unclassified Flagellimonas]UII74648.1 hypothetical protein LV716_10240 [Flagellimonas sp. HMM57]
MKCHLKKLLVLILIAIGREMIAQENADGFQKHSNLYISFGAGSSMLGQFPSDIYFSGSTNLQLGTMYERALHKRFSLVVGLELEQVSYNFDGDLELSSTLNIVQAGLDKKYTGIRQCNIAIPIQGRFYFLDNNYADSKNMFVQSGIRFIQSLDFIGPESLGTTYYYRSNGEDEIVSLADFTNQTAVQLELMIGFKGQFFKRFDLLNASTLGFMYQPISLFKDGSSEIYPTHFTWRFLF